MPLDQFADLVPGQRLRLLKSVGCWALVGDDVTVLTVVPGAIRVCNVSGEERVFTVPEMFEVTP